VDHHDYPQFLAAVGTLWTAESACPCKAYMIIRKPADHQLDQSAFARFKISEQQKSTFAFDIDDLTGAHNPYPIILILISLNLRNQRATKRYKERYTKGPHKAALFQFV